MGSGLTVLVVLNGDIDPTFLAGQLAAADRVVACAADNLNWSLTSALAGLDGRAAVCAGVKDIVDLLADWA